MAVLKAVLILLLFEATIINGRAHEYYSPAPYQEPNSYGTEWNYDTTTHSVAVQCSETKKPSPDPCIPSYPRKVEKEYPSKKNPCCPSSPNEPCRCEACCKPYDKPPRQRCCRPSYEPYDSYCQPSLCPRIKKKKDEVDPSKFLSNLLQLPLILVDGILEKDR